uniref:Uncharacterized protein n=1 Tax=Otolemur garnettii TaxID=30611 RepID=H0XSB9_OTOGA
VNSAVPLKQQQQQQDFLKFLATGTHLGGPNLDFQREQHIYTRHLLGHQPTSWRWTWEKLLLAARTFVAIETQRAVLKFAAATGAAPSAGVFTPETFTSQIHVAFREPRLLVDTDPGLTTRRLVLTCLHALCNTNSELVDIAVPLNNTGARSALIRWILAREVPRMRGTISEHPWEVMADLHFYRDQDSEKEEQTAAGKTVTKEEVPSEWRYAPAPECMVAQRRLQTGLKAARALCAAQHLLAADPGAQPAAEAWAAAPTAQAAD